MTYDICAFDRNAATCNIVARSMRALEFISHPRRIRECLSEKNISIHRRSKIVCAVTKRKERKGKEKKRKKGEGRRRKGKKNDSQVS